MVLFRPQKEIRRKILRLVLYDKLLLQNFAVIVFSNTKLRFKITQHQMLFDSVYWLLLLLPILI